MSVFHPPIPRAHDNSLRWSGLTGASASLAVASLAEQANKPVFVITANMHEAMQWVSECQFFTNNSVPVTLFSDWETLPYDHFSPHEDIISDRLSLLSRLPRLQSGITIASASTLMHRLCPSNYLTAFSFSITTGDKLNFNSLSTELVQQGYRHVSEVMEHGDFTIRGAILDCFPMGSDTPYRIELFDDEIDTIRSFDPETQRSIESLNKIDILPAHEFPLDDESISRFRQQWRSTFSGNPMDSPIYEAVSNGTVIQGLEYYLPLFFEGTSTMFDFCAGNTLFVTTQGFDHAARYFFQEAEERYEQLRYNQERPILDPHSLFLSPETLYTHLKQFTRISLQADNATTAFEVKEAPTFSESIKTNPAPKIKSFLSSHSDDQDYRILFCAESLGRREALLSLLSAEGITPKNVDGWNTFLNSDARIGMTVASMDSGFIIDDHQLILLCESDLYGQHVTQSRQKKASQYDPDIVIKNLSELSIGAPVVHSEHGVGRYQGLTLLSTGGVDSEYLTLIYANDDKVYVPVHALHLITRYSGAGPDNAPLHRLGSGQWDKVKAKAKGAIHDVAAELLNIYAKRESSQGFAFQAPNEDFYAFKAAFPYEETPDQTAAIEAIIDDMTQLKTMDRLVCGDVGFGKTEVAMQAAFLAVQSGKQVVVLVPTTLLCQQHKDNFSDRFADWPVNIASLSRLSTAKETEATLADLEAGKIDVLIGTHKLLNKSIAYKDLGLMIVDEEQRFGVRQKEVLKGLRAHVDILTLTATPIPRTLNLAMAGTRDLSIIATPPVKRLAIKTFVHASSDSIIREAILRETQRGGQVYFLFNDVSRIESRAKTLQSLIPECKVGFGHGQMRERELEKTMSDFYHQRFNVLVCSTIIESGIDIPSANTIIIDRADKFGLAQLHQLRGRVGRSHHQAYAYLLIPDHKHITKDAKRRLEALESLDTLGAGFLLATHDLEIRGAGNLLGDEQSGQIHEIGFSLYMELLNTAVKSLKAHGGNHALDIQQAGPTEINLPFSSLFPDSYIPDVSQRLSLYKRLSACDTRDALAELKIEIIDRFGTLPEASKTLLETAALSMEANRLGIRKIDCTQHSLKLHIQESNQLDPEKLIHCIQTQPEIYQLTGKDKLVVKTTLPSADACLQEIAAILQALI